MTAKGILTGVAVTLACAVVLRVAPQAQHRRPATLAVVAPADLRTWEPAIERMARVGDLRIRRVDADTLRSGRSHERLDQYYRGVRVRGGDVARQIDGGATISIFGSIYDDIAIDTSPRISVDQAAAIVQQASGVTLASSRQPELLILPEASGYRLVYRAVAFTLRGGIEYFIDADTGAIVRRLDAVQRQAAIGRGTGVLGDAKKMSVLSSGGVFSADDQLRPPILITFDMRGNVQRTLDFLNGRIALGASDRASDTDNVWTDTAVVDAHAYAGYTYDYYFRRFGRRGLDNNNLRLINIVHPANRADVLTQPPEIQSNLYLNAAYFGGGVMLYGEGLPPGITANSQSWNFLSGGLDIVGHELTHGVTSFTSGLLYENEPGALNESFSDMMGTAVEFFFQPSGNGPLRADYLCGEDVITPGGLRSLANPAANGQPDHYSRRLITGPPSEENDNGGVHTNSGIGNHAFYLAIEGGTNRTSGLTVTGVGAANRDQIERVMFRAFTQMMPANATYAVARTATIQAARDLYGAGSAAERAITQAWTAVGVN